MTDRGRCFLLYHYFQPDDVVSARLFADIALELSGDSDSASVIAMPANRSCHDVQTAYASSETWNGVEIKRVWRPAWKQSSNKGRLGNALFMISTWAWRSLWMRRSSTESVVIGTDPILAVLVAIPWRLFRPKSRIIFWCHDLYPQAAVADGLIRETSFSVRCINALQRIAYRRCDIIADLGGCMKRELMEASGATDRDREKFVTITPWALVEPTHVEVPSAPVRSELFGDARLGLLYSGNLGRAHEYSGFLKLARELTDLPVSFCFAGRGNRMDQLKEQVTDQDHNIRFAGFADEEQLSTRLAAADVHLVSLQDSWTGTVVPSKFFGALAIGRPVLFHGSEDCAIAHWIREYSLGWVLGPNTASELRQYAADPQARREMNDRCHRIYQEKFSKRVQLSAFKRRVLPRD